MKLSFFLIFDYLLFFSQLLTYFLNILDYRLALYSTPRLPCHPHSAICLSPPSTITNIVAKIMKGCSKIWHSMKIFLKKSNPHLKPLLISYKHIDYLYIKSAPRLYQFWKNIVTDRYKRIKWIEWCFSVQRGFCQHSIMIIGKTAHCLTNGMTAQKFIFTLGMERSRVLDNGEYAD